MIEFFTKKRMLLAVFSLIFISLSVMFLENKLFHYYQSKIGNSSCHLNDLKIFKECHQCSTDEKKKIQECNFSGYIKTEICEQNNLTFTFHTSCPMAGYGEKHFWLFEFIFAIIAVISSLIVYNRKQCLEKMLQDKVNKQIAAGS